MLDIESKLDDKLISVQRRFICVHISCANKVSNKQWRFIRTVNRQS